MKTLLLLRHGKSDWDADYGRDHDRPLNPRGVRSSTIIGRVLRARELVPDHAISSTAVRARTTLELAIGAGGWDCSVRLEPDFYGTGPETVIDISAGAPDVECLMLVGHQPTWSSLVHRLTDDWADMRTACVAVLEFDMAEWSELPVTRGEMSSLINPRSFFGGEWDTPS